MKKFALVAVLVLPALLLSRLTGADDKPKASDDNDKPKVGAMAPSPLDKAFDKATTERNIVDNLINNDLFMKAVKAALKAKQDREQAMKKTPIGPSPAQAARAAFLEALQNEAAAPADKGK
jgi:hypothetical protein